MAVPTVRAVGAVGRNGAGGTNPTLPAGTAEGDLLLMVAKSDHGQAFSCTGWSNVDNSPVQNASSTNNFRLTILYKIAGAGEGTPAPTSASGIWVARIIGITAGTFDAADPFDGSSTGSNNVSGTSTTMVGHTTTVADCLMLYALTSTRDEDNTAAFSNWTAPGGAATTERIDNLVSTSNGGGIGAATWAAGAAQAYGTGSVTHGNCGRNYMTLAIQPPAASTWVPKIISTY